MSGASRTVPDDPTPAGLYVHIPFCLTRCGYCDFNAYAGLDELKPRYLRALMAEAALAAPAWAGVEFVSVFLGGGTPTTISPDDLGSLLEHLRDRFEVSRDAEVTTEANPDTVDRDSLAALLAAGFDRLSMGAQSFDPAVLAALERLHGPDSVRRAFAAARSAGYSNVNLDLIYGAHGETIGSWERTLRETIGLAPEHISAYALTIEPATPLGSAIAAGKDACARPRPSGGHVRDGVRAAGPRTATATTRSRTGPSPATNAVTTSGTGSAGPTWAWAPGRTLTATTRGGGTSARPRNTWIPSSGASFRSAAPSRWNPRMPTWKRCSCACARSRASRPAGSTTTAQLRSSRAACSWTISAHWFPPSAACSC